MDQHNKDMDDQDEQIMGILQYLTEWLVNHILHVDGQIPQGWSGTENQIIIHNPIRETAVNAEEFTNGVICFIRN